ncbi:MAG TPA: rhomboid family intramembrane serine protease [Caulobacteraceae bacterium]|jgi:membrane associated rhomboid family serine protease|nr:rhomboid family intramembrane serine protease [Caulobacteraceae bacterium]
MDLTETEPETERRPREPVFQSPWTVVGLIGFILACFLAQSWFGLDATANAWGFSPAALDRGHWATLVSAIFLHGGWAHVLTNSAFILAFGTPVARRMGSDAAGAAAFFGYFLVCGVIGNLAFAALHPHAQALLIGASGSGSGLMAAASRLMTPYRRLAPFFSQPVVVMALAFLVANLIIAVVGWAPGAGDAQVAWEAHLGGYAAGLLLFEPVLALLRRG